VAPVAALPDDQYRLFAGYLDLAFARRVDAPPLAYDQLLAAYRVIRPVLPGDEAIHGVISMSAAWLRLGEGNIPEARKELADARFQLKQSVGEDHPYTAVAAMLAARMAQKENRREDAARELVRALRIRRMVLGLDRFASRTPADFDVARLSPLTTTHAVEIDTDSDGILDVLEVAVGLDPRRVDSDGDGVPDQDEDHDGDGAPNLLALGVAADPFLTVAQAGAHRPFGALWQSRHSTQQTAYGGPPEGWSVSTPSQGSLLQRLPAGLRERAIERGFSLFTRVTPGTGLAFATIDMFPSGQRFDLGLTRVSDSVVESRLLTDLVSQQGPTDRHPWPRQAPPLLELRYRPEEGTALYRDGQLVRARYGGHREFVSGAMSFAVMVRPGDEHDAASVFHLVWLEVR
jgi:hypothetical protein